MCSHAPQRVLVLTDGMPMNGARGNGPHPSLVDAEQIERVKVASYRQALASLDEPGRSFLMSLSTDI
jgi:hypothetical protein